MRTVTFPASSGQTCSPELASPLLFPVEKSLPLLILFPAQEAELRSLGYLNFPRQLALNTLESFNTTEKENKNVLNLTSF